MSTYQPQLKDEALAVPNTAALIAIGLSRGEAERFATLPYAALPKWVRTKIKRALTHNQPEPRKIKPAAGELAFYISPDRFPRKPQAQPGK